MDEVNADRLITGNEASTANRFPVRFVLFDNFRDCCSFVEEITHFPNINMVRLENWMDEEYPDTMLTHKKLADKVRELIRTAPSEYRVIMPFSEIARFYDNNPNKAEFNTLISTIKCLDTIQVGFDHRQRIYIPIVGLEGKMQNFSEDSQSFIWYFRNPDRQLNYKLILLDNTTYGVTGLDYKYNVASNVTDFLSFWQYPELKENIISTSHSIFSHANYAQPDNAFSYSVCRNAYEFLTKGLELEFGNIQYREEDSCHWEELAKLIDVQNFELDKFIHQQFGIFDLADYNVFFEVWFKFKLPFHRWLLAKYYENKFCNQGYICRVLDNLTKYGDLDFAKEIAMTIFKLDNPQSCIEERKIGLQRAFDNGIELSQDVQLYIVEKIEEEEKRNGIISALQYLTSSTMEEKKLIFKWYSEGKIQNDVLLELYPDLYHYLGSTSASSEDSWVLDYFDQYKYAKVVNRYTEPIKNYITEKNKNEVTHALWTSKFPDTKTILYSRTDISHYVWIDGLGVEWIPFIQSIVKEKEQDGYYLNEAYVATAKLPTRTDVNKVSILELSKDKLEKIGDLDEVAHTIRPYPRYIIEDMFSIKKIIGKLLSEHPGEKIAILSDHGISYLPQLCQGYNLQGYSSDHWGRIVETSKSSVVSDEKYVISELENGNKALCALRHESLGKKIPEGMGCHGGCTPEEQLVPIIIISPEKDSANWHAVIKTFDIEEANPCVVFNITGLDGKSNPIIEYDKRTYGMTSQGDTYTSQRLSLNKDVKTITLIVGTQRKDFEVNIKLAAEENDLFSF